MKWLRVLGPAFITASVVLGPGSIVTASKVGAGHGYSLIWMPIVCTLFMVTYTSMAARFACVSSESLLEALAREYGRWLSILLGISAFVVVAGFQSSNNISVAAAMEPLLPLPVWVWPLLFTGLSIYFLFAAKDLYQILERAMMVLVGVMIVAFLYNLVLSLFHAVPAEKELPPPAGGGNLLVITGFFATTFSVVAAFFQAYLVQEKRWTLKEYRLGIRDAVAGISVLGLISLVIMVTAARTLRGQMGEIKDIAALSQLLRGSFGGFSIVIFSIGLLAAAFSSFIVNAMIGGTLLSDGLGLGKSLESRSARLLTVVALLIGMAVALAVYLLDFELVHSIVVAQASTLVAVPFCALALLVVCNKRSIMGQHVNGPTSNLLAGAGFLVLCWMVIATGRKIWFYLTSSGL